MLLRPSRKLFVCAALRRPHRKTSTARTPPNNTSSKKRPAGGEVKDGSDSHERWAMREAIVSWRWPSEHITNSMVVIKSTCESCDGKGSGLHGTNGSWRPTLGRCSVAMKALSKGHRTRSESCRTCQCQRIDPLSHTSACREDMRPQTLCTLACLRPTCRMNGHSPDGLPQIGTFNPMSPRRQ